MSNVFKIISAKCLQQEKWGGCQVHLTLLHFPTSKSEISKCSCLPVECMGLESPSLMCWGARHRSSTLELAAGKIGDLQEINWVISQKTKTWEISSTANTKPITVSPKIAIGVTESGSAIIFLVHICWLQPPTEMGAGINKKQQIKLVLLSSNSFYWSSNSFIYDK